VSGRSDDLILITGDDPPSLARAVAASLGEPIPWVGAGDERASAATVWFASSLPPASTLPLPSLRWIHCAWAGVDRWIGRPEWREGVTLTRTIADLPRRMADYVIGYLLAMELDVARSRRQQEARRWERWTAGTFGGKTMLIGGYGEIGRVLGAGARAMGIRVLGLRRGPVTAAERAEGVIGSDALPRSLAEADYVVNLLPATPETEAFWNAARFAAMKQEAIFVNVSRGRSVDDEALLAGLDRGRPGHAILDVFRKEPLPPESPYWGHPRVWVTAHVAGLGTDETEGAAFADNWRRWRANEPLAHVVDRARGY
jgi:glyoxylate/hydroxypyruvate reductase A